MPYRRDVEPSPLRTGIVHARLSLAMYSAVCGGSSSPWVSVFWLTRPQQVRAGSLPCLQTVDDA